MYWDGRNAGERGGGGGHHHRGGVVVACGGSAVGGGNVEGHASDWGGDREADGEGKGGCPAVAFAQRNICNG